MEVGFNSPSRKRAHFTSTKGDKARKAQERGERNHINIIDEADYHVGAFPYPFRGHEVACRLLQPLWGRQRPTARSYSHSAADASGPLFVGELIRQLGGGGGLRVSGCR
eukprot:scaffold29041_cov94-Isochrysis_galbana.AAC.1